MLLDREEFIEQAYFFRSLRERLAMNLPMQELLANLREEVLSTTKLPMAIDFLATELLHEGLLHPGMKQLSHYFMPFQTYVIAESERERGRFDMRVGLDILQREAEYRAKEPTRAGIFLYHFETISRNRLRYDPGLAATAEDPVFDDDWKAWLQELRHQVGIVDLADLVYFRSQHYLTRQERLGQEVEVDTPILFGEKEGQIAFANRRKEPLLLLLALQRHLGYPAVPRPEKQENSDLVPQMSRRIERLESRLKLLEDEQKGGIDITQFYGPADSNKGMGASDSLRPGDPNEG